MARGHVLHKVRTALGRSAGQAPAPVPPALLRIPEMPLEERIARMFRNIEALAGKTFLAGSDEEARAHVAAIVEGKTAIASGAGILKRLGILDLAGVAGGITDPVELRRLCAASGIGITGAAYALAETGTLVLLVSPDEARLVSLLPPVHIAVVERERILTGLDELFTVLPTPCDTTSSMIFITGPSRTADIEQILVRGVHGPGTIHVVVR